MFHLTPDEFKNLRFQNGTSSWGGTRIMPQAFTGQGVAMLSSVSKADTDGSFLVQCEVIDFY